MADIADLTIWCRFIIDYMFAYSQNRQMSIVKTCIKCGQAREIGRKMCRPCFLNEKRKRAKLKYRIYGRHFLTITCDACATQFKGWKRNSKLCPSCYKLKLKLASQKTSTNKYTWSGLKGKFRHLHRAIAERKLKRHLATNEIVHHMNDNPKDNEINNLIVMDRRTHGKLHLYLDTQRVIIEKSMNENLRNCWKSLIVPMTTAWLETTGAKVIKLWEIGKSAAEPLKKRKVQRLSFRHPNPKNQRVGWRYSPDHKQSERR